MAAPPGRPEIPVSAQESAQASFDQVKCGGVNHHLGFRREKYPALHMQFRIDLRLYGILRIVFGKCGCRIFISNNEFIEKIKNPAPPLLQRLHRPHLKGLLIGPAGQTIIGTIHNHTGTVLCCSKQSFASLGCLIGNHMGSDMMQLLRLEG